MKKKIGYEYHTLMGDFWGSWYGYIRKWYGWKKVMLFKDKESAETWLKREY